MKEFLDGLTTPAWWISVVLVGLLINFASSALEKVIPKFFQQGLEWYRKRNAAEAARWDQELTRLRSNPHGVALSLASETRSFLKAIAMLVLAVLMVATYIFVNVKTANSTSAFSRAMSDILAVCMMVMMYAFLLMSTRFLKDVVQFREITKRITDAPVMHETLGEKLLDQKPQQQEACLTDQTY